MLFWEGLSPTSISGCEQWRQAVQSAASGSQSVCPSLEFELQDSDEKQEVDLRLEAPIPLNTGCLFVCTCV